MDNVRKSKQVKVADLKPGTLVIKIYFGEMDWWFLILKDFENRTLELSDDGRCMRVNKHFIYNSENKNDYYLIYEPE